MARRAVPGSLRGWVDRAVEDVPDDWRVALARKLADALDEEPQASMARELRSLMAAIDAGRELEEHDVADELRARRAARIADASNQ